MTVDSTHPQYDASLPAWLRARDVLAGEDAVKRAGEKYLPRLDSQTNEEYVSYGKRAAFFNATGRTLEEYLDLIFRRAPVILMQNGECRVESAPQTQDSLSARLKSFVEDCDGWATGFQRYARRVVSEVLSVGRGGTAMLGNAQDGKAWVRFWRAEDILNWKVSRMDGRMVLTGVVLMEKVESRKLKAETGRLRVFRLIASECFEEVWSQVDPPLPGSREASQLMPEVSDATSEGQWMLEQRTSVKRDGVPLHFIPFVFHGPRHSRPETDQLPLADIIAANLDHYRLDADYKHGLHFTALPTAWVSGFEKDATLRIGSSSAWMGEAAGASAGFLEFSGRGLSHLERAIEKVERRMTLMGAEMLSSSVSSQPSTTLSGLGSIVANLNQSLSRVLQLAQWWIDGGELERLTGRAHFEMNTDLDARAMSGDEITSVVGAWRSGAISRETMLERLKRGEVLPDGRSIAAERELIHGKGDRR